MPKVKLVTLTTELMSPNYVSWMNDIEVNRYLEARHVIHDLRTVSRYVQSCYDSAEIELYGIFLCEENLHIGNLKLNLNFVNLRAEVGLFIGEKSFWGQGLATQAILQSCNLSKSGYGLRKITSGLYSKNHSSQRAFEKAGFRFVGKRESHFVFNDGYDDQLLYEKML